MIRYFIFLMLLVVSGNSHAANYESWYTTTSAASAACNAGAAVENQEYKTATNNPNANWTNCSTTGSKTDTSKCGGNGLVYYWIHVMYPSDPNKAQYNGCVSGFKPCSISGQIRNTSGICVCPPGEEVINGVCAVPACPIDGQVRDPNGQCVCPEGQIVQNNQCVEELHDCPAAGTTETQTRLTAFISTGGELFYNKSRTPQSRKTAPDGSSYWCDVTVGPPTNCTLEKVSSHSSAIANEHPSSVGKKGAIKVCEYKLTYAGGKGRNSTTGDSNSAGVNKPSNPTNVVEDKSVTKDPTVINTNPDGSVTEIDKTVTKSGEGVEIVGSYDVTASDGTVTTVTITKNTKTNPDGSKDIHYEKETVVKKNPVVKFEYDDAGDRYNPRVTPGNEKKDRVVKDQHLNPDGSNGGETESGGGSNNPLPNPDGFGSPGGSGSGGGGTVDTGGNDTQPGDDKDQADYRLKSYQTGTLSDDGSDSRLTAAKTAYSTTLAAIKTEAKGVLDFTVSGGDSVALPNIHIADIKGVSIDANLNQWSDSLSVIGDVLVFTAYITALFMILGVRGGGE